MFTFLTCPQGHQWQLSDGETESQLRCPVCGAAGDFPETVLQTDLHGDGIPPPPSPTPSAVQEVAAGFVPSPNESAPQKLPTVTGYEVLGILGRGGMGVVYRAWQTKLRRLVALKMIRGGIQPDPEDLARFGTEAEAVARLQHPNIVQIYEIGEQDGHPFFSLEYVEGGSLAQKLNGTPLPPKQAAELLAVLADAVHYAHQKGVIHRDLKPGNVLLVSGGAVSGNEVSGGVVSGGVVSGEEAGPTNHSPLTTHQPKITDFGLAKLLVGGADQTQTGAVMGTPSYMAPEQAGGQAREIGPATDVYALGAILYETLTGRPPFRAQSSLETIAQVKTEEPVPPSRLQSKVPRDLETICLKCLQKLPRQRYPSAQALAADLRRFLAGEPIQARPASVWERSWKWARRRPALAALLGTLVVAAVALTAAIVSLFHNVELTRAHQAEEHQRKEAETARAVAEQARDDATSAQKREAAARKGEEKQRKRAEKAHADLKDAHAKLKDTHEVLKNINYYNRIGVAEREWLANNVARADELLDDPEECEPRLRGWEWYYLKRLCHSYLFSIKAHRTTAAAVAFSPDGSLLASASQDKTVKIWNAGRLIHVLAGHQFPVTTLAFSPDGQQLASGSGDFAAARTGGEVILWNPHRGEKILALPGHKNRIWSLAFSPPDGRLLASASDDKTVILWDVAKGKEVFVFKEHTDPVLALAFRPDGKRIASVASGQVKIWDPNTGKVDLSLGKIRGNRIFSIAFSPDGRRLAWAGDHGDVKIWDTETADEDVLLRGHHTWIATSVAFSPDGKELASASRDQTVKIWDAASGDEKRTLRGHTAAVRHVTFSPDGRRLATAGDDGTVLVWDALARNRFSTLRSDKGFIASEAFSQDGKLLAVVVGSNTPVSTSIKIYDLATARLLRLLMVRVAFDQKVALSSDGDRIAVPSAAMNQPGEVKIWDVGKDKKFVTLMGHASQVQCVAFSYDGQRIASISLDKTVRLWDARTGNELGIFTNPNDTSSWNYKYASLAFSPDGKYLAAAIGSRLHIWDTATAKVIQDLRGHRNAIWRLQFSPDSQSLASASADKTVRVWDVASGKVRLTLKGHAAAVYSLAYHPDGKRLVSSGSDQTLKIWDTATGHEIMTLRGHTSIVQNVAFSSDGHRIFSTSRGGIVRKWEGTPMATPSSP